MQIGGQSQPCQREREIVVFILLYKTYHIINSLQMSATSKNNLSKTCFNGRPRLYELGKSWPRDQWIGGIVRNRSLLGNLFITHADFRVDPID